MKRQCQNRWRKDTSVTGSERAIQDKDRGRKLLPYEVRENLPILGSQQGKDGRAKVWARCVTTDGALSWYITEGSARRDPEGKAVDYLLYGLVEDQGRRLDYFWLSDLESLGSAAGAPVVRDCRWQPKSLAEIAPEMFKNDQEQLED